MLWRDGTWTSTAPERPQVVNDGTSQLGISIYDSDYATFTYSSPAGAYGMFYLGIEPADLFDDPAASELVDHKRQAKAFARWVRETTGRSITARSVRKLMARPGKAPADAFVESDVASLLILAGLTEPDWDS